MPLQIIRNDITKVKCDAIVNAANSSLLGGGGVDGAIHRAAGKELLFACRLLGGCKTGQAKITEGYALPCRYVIHTVGPKWNGGGHGEKELLESCYWESLKLAKENRCDTVAFPLISSGIYGYPKDQALRVAVDTISAFLAENEMTVYLVMFDKNSFQISTQLFAEIQSYIDDCYAALHTDTKRERLRSFAQHNATAVYRSKNISQPEYGAEPKYGAESEYGAQSACDAVCEESPISAGLQEAVRQIDESFSQMLLRKIDERGISDAECYKKANVDRKLFSKIRSDRFYRPSKTTAIAFAVALELDLDEAKDMLMKAGFALSHSNKFDIIIEFFIKNRNYNIFEINEALFAFDQSLLGG